MEVWKPAVGHLGYDISMQAVSKIARGERWRHI